jgi:hypothetical protein
MYGTYFIVVFFAILVAYAGVEETMKLFVYADLQLRYAFVRVQMRWMGWKLKRQLVRDTTDFKKFLANYENEHEDLP